MYMVADLIDHAGNLCARRERPLGLDLIEIANDQRIGIVDAASMDADANLIWPAIRVINLFQR